MSEKINLTELREAALRSDADSFVHGVSLWVKVPTLLALVETVEAARMYRIRHAANEPNAGQKITRDNLDEALARFEFGQDR